jgi:acyl-CoA thioesterase FadM
VTEGRFPFVHRRRVRWGDSDPARIAYTARFGDFAMEAIEAFFLDRLGAGFYELNLDHGIGTPFVRVEFEFRSPLTPRDTLETEVRLERLGGSSAAFALAGRVGVRLAFEAKLICACVAVAGPVMKPIPWPSRFRDALAADAAFAQAG